MAREESHASAVLADVSQKRTALGDQARDETKHVREAHAQLQRAQSEFEAQIAEQHRLEQACRNAENAAEREKAECERLKQAIGAENKKSAALEADVKVLKEQVSTTESRAQDVADELKKAEQDNRDLRDKLHAVCTKADKAAAETKILQQQLQAKERALLKLGKAARDATREMRTRVETLEGALSEACLSAAATPKVIGPVAHRDASPESKQAHQASQEERGEGFQSPRTSGIHAANQREEGIQSPDLGRPPRTSEGGIHATCPWNPLKEEEDLEDTSKRCLSKSFGAAPEVTSEAKRQRLWSQSFSPPHGITIQDEQTVID